MSEGTMGWEVECMAHAAIRKAREADIAWWSKVDGELAMRKEPTK